MTTPVADVTAPFGTTLAGLVAGLVAGADPCDVH